jgi:hypothetical protein
MPRIITMYWWEKGKSRISFSAESALEECFAKGYANFQRANPDTGSTEKVFDAHLRDFQSRAEAMGATTESGEGTALVYPTETWRFKFGPDKHRIVLKKKPLHWKGLGTEMVFASIVPWTEEDAATPQPAVQPVVITDDTPEPTPAAEPASEAQEPVAVAAQTGDEVSVEAATNFDAGDMFK